MNNSIGQKISKDAILSKSVYDGYSDCELELLCDSSGINTGNAPWAYWTSEIYSFGRLYREWALYPKFLPLYIYSDHGVHKPSGFTSHEVENDAKVHFVFNQKRVEENAGNLDKNVLCVPHPWVTYRKKNNIAQLLNATGTLVYFSHSCEGMELSGHDGDEYFDMLDALPDKFKPLVICMHMHDIKKGYHSRLRRRGIPIVTAGNTSDVRFVDSFYGIARQFKYATSNVGGSQLYYCVEMGIPYFLLGGKIKFENLFNPSLPLGDASIVDAGQMELVQIESQLFRRQVDIVTPDQLSFVARMLGMSSGITRFQVWKRLWYEFFRNFNKWHIMFRPTAVWFVRKIGLLNLLKRYRNRKTDIDHINDQ